MNYNNRYITILYLTKWNIINQSYKWFNKNLSNYIVSSNIQKNNINEKLLLFNWYKLLASLSIIRILLFVV